GHGDGVGERGSVRHAPIQDTIRRHETLVFRVTGRSGAKVRATKPAAPVHRLDRLGPMPAVTLVAPPAEACVVEVGSVRVHVILSQTAFVPIASGAVLEGARTAGDVPSAAVVPPTDLEACRLGRGVHELAAPTPVEVKFADRRVGDAEL